MTRQVVVPGGAYAVPCEMAARMRRETGRAAPSAEALDHLLEDRT